MLLVAPFFEGIKLQYYVTMALKTHNVVKKKH
jgi:hypothetical protein